MTTAGLGCMMDAVANLTRKEKTVDWFPRIYSIRIHNALHDRWKTWFDGMTVTRLDCGDTIIEGLIQDQSELVGIINQLHSLNLTLVSVNCEE